MNLAFATRNSRVRYGKMMNVVKPSTMKSDTLDVAITTAEMAHIVATVTSAGYVGRHRDAHYVTDHYMWGKI